MASADLQTEQQLRQRIAELERRIRLRDNNEARKPILARVPLSLFEKLDAERARRDVPSISEAVTLLLSEKLEGDDSQ